MIVLVTGSREYPYDDRADIFKVLDHYFQELCTEPTDRFIVRHGAARGVDHFASMWVAKAREFLGEWCDLVDEDPWPVSPEQWRRSPHLAGKNRNLAMINADPPPDLCLAFSYQSSGGTAHCWRQARIAGIQTPDIFAWEAIHGYPHHPGAGDVVAAVPRAEQPARAPGHPHGDRLF